LGGIGRRTAIDVENEQTIVQLLNESSVAIADGDTRRAQKALREAMRVDPVTLELVVARRAWGNLAGGDATIRRRREAISQRLGSVAVAAPERTEVWCALAEFLKQLGNHDGVLKATASGLKRDPTSVELWVRRVGAQIELKQVQSAARSLRHLVQLAPTHDVVESLVRFHPLCASCGALLTTAGADECVHCGADGPGRGAPVRSVRARHQSKFDVYFPKVRDVLAESLNMPDHVKRRLTLDTLLKRHLKRSNEQCARALNAMAKEFGPAFDAPLFDAAVVGFLDVLVADLIRAINPQKDSALESSLRHRAIHGTQS
jgi:tetratricopeptide (TPR) repeat protein